MFHYSFQPIITYCMLQAMFEYIGEKHYICALIMEIVLKCEIYDDRNIVDGIS